MIKVLTTMDYLQSHDFSNLKGQNVKIFITEPQLDVVVINKLMALQITPEFVTVERSQLPFVLGYTFGRILQSNSPVVVLSDEFVAPAYMEHRNAFVTNDFHNISKTQLNKEPVTASNEDIGVDNVIPAPKKRGRKPRKALMAAEVNTTVKETPQELLQEVLAEPKQNDIFADVEQASSTETTIEDRNKIRALLVPLNVMDLVASSHLSEDEFLTIFIQSVKDAYEYISFEMQLQVHFQNMELAQNIYKLTKKSFDDFKKIVDKI